MSIFKVRLFLEGDITAESVKTSIQAVSEKMGAVKHLTIKEVATAPKGKSARKPKVEKSEPVIKPIPKVAAKKSKAPKITYSKEA